MRVLPAGEPRDMNDPANASFMNSISSGECPRELAPSKHAPASLSLRLLHLGLCILL